jgi:hypothetical protein
VGHGEIIECNTLFFVLCLMSCMTMNKVYSGGRICGLSWPLNLTKHQFF